LTRRPGKHLPCEERIAHLSVAVQWTGGFVAVPRVIDASSSRVGSTGGRAISGSGPSTRKCSPSYDPARDAPPLDRSDPCLEATGEAIDDANAAGEYTNEAVESRMPQECVDAGW